MPVVYITQIRVAFLGQLGASGGKSGSGYTITRAKRGKGEGGEVPNSGKQEYQDGPSNKPEEGSEDVLVLRGITLKKLPDNSSADD